MSSRFRSPKSLVEALHNRDEAARRQLRAWLGDPLRRVVQELHARHHLPHQLDRLIIHALHAAEAYLLMKSVGDFAAMSEPAFRAAVLFQVARQMVQPFGRSDPSSPVDPLPESDLYACQTVFLPSESVGGLRFGGDWFGGRRAEDGTLWLIVADITGHGYAASLLANALPAAWRKCWADHRFLASPSPGAVLDVLHDLLAHCLPEDVYVECTLLRLDPQGRATVAPAGGSKLMLRRQGEDRLDLVKLRGLWLGMERTTNEEHGCVLEAGDELLFGSDGVFDQLQDYGGPGGDLVRLIEGSLHRGGLLDAVRHVLDRALRAEPQKDDITVVTVRRRSQVNGEPGA